MITPIRLKPARKIDASNSSLQAELKYRNSLILSRLTYILLTLCQSLISQTALSASLEWDSQLLRFIMATNLAVKQGHENLILPDAENERAVIPGMPSVPAQLDISVAPSQKPVQTNRSEMISVLLPDGGAQTSITVASKQYDITDGQFVSQTLSRDSKLNLTLTSFAYMPIDSLETLSKAAYTLSVDLYAADGHILSSGAGSLQLDLAKSTLQFQSTHNLQNDTQLNLQAQDQFQNGQIAGSLQSRLQVVVDVTDNPTDKLSASC